MGCTSSANAHWPLNLGHAVLRMLLGRGRSKVARVIRRRGRGKRSHWGSGRLGRSASGHWCVSASEKHDSSEKRDSSASESESENLNQSLNASANVSSSVSVSGIQSESESGRGNAPQGWSAGNCRYS